jgi:predicted RNase H-like HicB family nuclease
MEPSEKLPGYSYLVTWSEKDQEFVATFLELPELSGLAKSIPNAIREARTALAAWLQSARKYQFEIPQPSMPAPCMILDAQFTGKLPVQYSDLPEELIPAGANQTGSALKDTGAAKVVRYEKPGQVVEA